MSNPQQEEDLRNLARGIEELLNKIYGQKMGFFLCVSPFLQDDAVADYIANCERKDGVAWMRETADRLEENQDIPATQGEA